MTATEPTADEPIARAAALRPLLERNAPQGDADRRIPTRASTRSLRRGC
jgi:hypothetical protein